MNPRRRRSDRCYIVRVWDAFEPYWEIICTISGVIVVSILWIGNVQGYDGRIIESVNRISVVERDIETIKQDTAAIKESLRWIEKSMGKHK